MPPRKKGKRGGGNSDSSSSSSSSSSAADMITVTSNRGAYLLLFAPLYLVVFLFVVFQSNAHRPTTTEQTVYFLLLVVPAVYFLGAHAGEILRAWTVRGADAAILPQMTLIVVIVSLAYCFMTVVDNTPSLFPLLWLFVVISILVVALAILYEVLQYFKMHADGRGIGTVTWLAFFQKLIFYIPCLLLDALRSLSDELENTPNMILFVVLIEFALIILYANLNWILALINVRGEGLMIVNEPSYLFFEQTAATAKNFIPQSLPPLPAGASAADTTKLVPMYPAQFAISLWIFINPKNSSHLGYVHNSNVFRFGDPGAKTLKAGHPALHFFNKPLERGTLDNNAADFAPDAHNRRLQSQDHHKRISPYTDSQGDALPIVAGGGVLRVYYGNDDPNHFIDIAAADVAARWAHCVCNYTENSFDFYIDAVLVASKPLDDIRARPRIFDNDAFIVGDNSGLDGSVCNAVFYSRPLLPDEITRHFTLLKDSNPPAMTITR